MTRSLDVLRDRLLLALTDAAAQGRQPAALVAVEPGAALVSGIGPLPLWVITGRVADGPQVLEARVRGAALSVRGGPVAVAVLSGDDEVAGWSRSIAASVPERVGAFYLLDDRGAVRVLSGLHLRELVEAHDRAAAGVGFPADHELEAAVATRRRGLVQDAIETRDFAERVSAAKPVVTWSLVGACVAVFLLQLLWGSGDPTLVAGRMGAGSGERLFQGDWWRLLSPAFLHGSLAHIAMNMMALMALGPSLEAILGRSRFAALYLLSAVGASLTTAYVNPGVSSVGASGAVWGLMGAMLGLSLRPNGLLPRPLVARLRKSMWTPIVINVAISFLPGIDMFGHFGGGAAGLGLMLSGVLTGDLRRRAQGHESARPVVFAALAGVLALAAAASLGAAISTGQPWALNQPPRWESVRFDEHGFEARLPAGLGTAMELPPAPDGVTTVARGNLAIDPVVVQLSVARSAATMVDVARELERELQANEPAKMVTVDGRELVVITSQSRGLPLHTAATVVDGFEVAVFVVRHPKASPVWEDVAGKVAASVRALE